MPAQGLEWLKNEQLLSLEELVRLGRIGVERLGIERIRITGGEPLLRRDLEQLVAALAQLRTHAGIKPDLALTTNGGGFSPGVCVHAVFGGHFGSGFTQS